MRFVEVPHGSELYESTVRLRDRVLRAPLGLCFSPEQLAAEHADHHLAVLDGETVLACLVLSPIGEGRVKMRQVAVEPGLQGAGLGSKLVAFAEEYAAGKGYREMVASARESAVRFYERLGYAVEGEPYEEVTLPHRWIRKALG